MIDGLEALSALAEWGTMTRAATHLRVTQSAVSKRIHSLEEVLGVELVERSGRRVILTSGGTRLLGRAGPLLVALKEALDHDGDDSETEGVLAVGVSESILASWGPSALKKVRRRMPGLELRVHAHRSPVAVDGVLAGEYVLALVSGSSERVAGLTSIELEEEEIVVVPSELRHLVLRRGGRLAVTSIERESATGRALRRRLGLFRRESGVQLEVQETLESFACIVQLARTGFGHGLVPMGIARAMGVPKDRLVRLPKPGLWRPISLVGRRSSLQRPLVARFRAELQRVRGAR